MPILEALDVPAKFHHFRGLQALLDGSQADHVIFPSFSLEDSICSFPYYDMPDITDRLP